MTADQTKDRLSPFIGQVELELQRIPGKVDAALREALINRHPGIDLITYLADPKNGKTFDALKATLTEKYTARLTRLIGFMRRAQNEPDFDFLGAVVEFIFMDTLGLTAEEAT